MDAEQYYSELEEKLTDEFNAEKHRISLMRLGIAFVTFRDERMTDVWVNYDPWPLSDHGNALYCSFLQCMPGVPNYMFYFPITGFDWICSWVCVCLFCVMTLCLCVVYLRSIVKDYSRVRCRQKPQQSSITTVVQSHRWGVDYAPAPSDIIWWVSEGGYLKQIMTRNSLPLIT